MSTITAIVKGDARLARLLASAASSGWHGPDDLRAIVRRCEWPADLSQAVNELSEHQVASLARSALILLAAFERPEEVQEILGPLLDHCQVRFSPEGTVLTAGGCEKDITITAAIGLINLVASNGPESLAICAWPGCNQPLTRMGRHRTSNACSRPCANRIRVARHRQATLPLRE